MIWGEELLRKGHQIFLIRSRFASLNRASAEEEAGVEADEEDFIAFEWASCGCSGSCFWFDEEVVLAGSVGLI